MTKEYDWRGWKFENKEHKAQWIAALRTKGMHQCNGALADLHETHTSYCCLGVYADKVLGCTIKKTGAYTDVYTPDRKQLATGYLRLHSSTSADRELFGDIPSHAQNNFAHMNDNKKWSFKKIAAYIERYL